MHVVGQIPAPKMCEILYANIFKTKYEFQNLNCILASKNSRTQIRGISERVFSAARQRSKQSDTDLRELSNSVAQVELVSIPEWNVQNFRWSLTAPIGSFAQFLVSQLFGVIIKFLSLSVSK